MSTDGGVGGRRGGPDPAPAEETDLVTELRRVLLVSSRVLRSRTADEDVSTSQYSVLAFLLRTGASTPGELAGFEHVSPPVMTRTLARLETAGLVRRGAHPTDGRQVRVSLTPEGEDVVRRGRAERDAWLRSRVERLDATDRAGLREAVDLLRRALVDAPPEEPVMPERPRPSEEPGASGEPGRNDGPGLKGDRTPS